MEGTSYNQPKPPKNWTERKEQLKTEALL